MNYTDLEICKQVAEIKGLDWCLHPELGSTYITKQFSEVSAPNLYWHNYNPLTDDTITADLIDEYYLEVGRYGTWYGVFQGDKPLGSDGCLSYELSLRKAVALAVIALDDKFK